MAYVDGYFDRQRDVLRVVERNNGKREFKEFPARYQFYYQDPRGKFKSIFGDSLDRVVCNTSKKFNTEKKIHGHKKLFESDLNPLFRCFSENYDATDTPDLQTAFFDIETDFDQEKGFAPPEDPFNQVTAVSVHLSWLERTICLAIKPNTLTKEQATEICNKFEDTMLFDTENAMLEAFLDLIDDADILTGWNSEGFDIPYMVNRIARVLSKSHTRKFCLWDLYPKRRMFERFGAENETFDLIGRVHLDYMQLYRKYTYHEMHSYSLDAIGEYELNERKVEYEGTLDQLFNNDFETFIAYSRQDVDLLVRLDAKLQFIDLANVLAHSNTVLLQTTMGAVAQTDQAIVNEAHQQGFIVPDKKYDKDTTQAAGAYVADPKRGMHKWIGSMDLNSLYPSIIRSCNMSTETIIGQVRHTFTRELLEKAKTIPEAWEGRFATPEYELVMAKDTTEIMHIDFEGGENFEATGAEIYEIIFNSGQPWIISANGTIFTYEKKGIIPGLLERWYAERKILQKNAIDAREEGGDKFAYWDKRQLVKKINLNSLYGALLNPGSRFFDSRLGQSTTLTGRSIARHMAAKVNEIMAGEYNHVGDAIVYGDTDSTYFSAYPMLKDEIEKGEIEWTKDSITAYYEAVCEEVNKTFPNYMNKAFHTTVDLGAIIAAGREISAQSGLFITKKRYAALVYDNEGKREDTDGKPGKVKAMGLDLKRSDTPAFMQEFLKELLMTTLTDGTEEAVIKRIIEFRKEFRGMDSWKKGTPKRVNNLTKFRGIVNKYDKTKNNAIRDGRSANDIKKPALPGHVRAALNWNTLRDINSDKYSIEINDGMKTIVCKLKDNPLGYTSVGYPTDETRLPDWFTALPFDDDLMEHTIITKKLDNLLGVLKWDLDAGAARNTFADLFDF
jgi:DNA polymerase elongation subunit (family B)|tara:strand:+ start:2941 stop:5634 length:2694 start_codon:yes stop_codon:yes gene_type:complete